MQTVKFTLPTPAECNADNYAENLREIRSGTDRALVPVGAPEVITDDAGLLTFELPDGEILLVDSDLQQLTAVAAEPQAQVRTVGCLSAALRSALTVSATEVVLLTDDGPEWLTRDSTADLFELRGPVPERPTVRFATAVEQSVEAYVEPFTLTGSYLRGSGVLTDADCQVAGAALLTAYDAMKASATASGLKLQPVLMMWRMKDDAGRVLRQGVPQWVAAPAGFNGLDSIELQVTKADGDSNFNSVSGGYMTMQAHRVTVELDGAANISDFWREKIASLELLMSADIDFTTLTDRATGRMDSVNSAQSAATLHLPGAGSTQALRTLVVNALAQFHSTAVVVATVAHPFATGAASEVELNLPSNERAGSTEAVDATLAALAMPHRFAADVTYGSGTAMIFGNIKSVPAQTMLPADYAAAVGSDTARQWTVAKMADGRQRAAMSSARAAVSTLPPLLVYPSVDAVALTMQVDNRRKEFALIPSACGRYAYYLAPGLADFSTAGWDTATWSAVSGTDGGTSRPNLLLTASADDPLTPVAAQVVCRDSLLRLTASMGATGGWNYGRQHLMAWADDGVYAVSIDRTLTTVASTLLRSPGVVRADAVALGTRCTYAVDPDGILLRWQGSNATALTVPTSTEKPVAVMWCRTTSELWVMHADGAITVLTEAGGCYKRTDLTAVRFVGEYPVDGDGALRMAALEREATEVSVTWRRRWAAATPLRRGVAVWSVDAAAAQLTLTLMLDGGGAPQRLLQLRVNGVVNAPIAAAYRAPLRPYVTALLSGTLTAPARALTLTF